MDRLGRGRGDGHRLNNFKASQISASPFGLVCRRSSTLPCGHVLRPDPDLPVIRCVQLLVRSFFGPQLPETVWVTGAAVHTGRHPLRADPSTRRARLPRRQCGHYLTPDMSPAHRPQPPWNREWRCHRISAGSRSHPRLSCVLGYSCGWASRGSATRYRRPSANQGRQVATVRSARRRSSIRPVSAPVVRGR